QKGYEKLTPIQKCCIPIILKKKKYDLMAHANTGSGKTAAFLLPIIDILQEWKMNNNHYSNSNSPLALILAPTRDLCQQHYEEARAFTIGTRVHVAACYGEYDIPQNLRDIRHGCDILCATSGRLLQFLSDGHIKLDKLLFFVMDEADRLLQDSFIQDIEMLHRSFAENPTRRTYMFSATYNEEVQGMAKKFLNANYFFVRIGILNSAVQNVEQNFIEVTQQDKRDLLKELLESNATRVIDEETGKERLLVPKTMIFVEQKRCCDRLACTLLTMNIICQSLNSDRNQKQREEALNMFVKGDIDVLVCTNVAARGLNIKGVKHVINYDLPWDRDNYVHRIGRTGRVGHKGMSTSFIVSTNYREIQMAHELIDILNEVGQTPPKFLEDMAMISKIRRNSGNRAVAALAPRYSPPSYEETPFECPYFYLSTTSYYDYRNGSAEVYTAAGCSASNTALVAVYNVMLMVAKSSTVLFGFAVYIAMFLLTLLLKKKPVNKYRYETLDFEIASRPRKRYKCPSSRSRQPY
uniref:RNA helicase n=1 Tax=Acrobeloides nanus TaxID=290746 RepID=A0A914EFN6_9BILA